MSGRDILEAAAVAAVAGLIFYLPRRFSHRHRAMAGAVLFMVAWGGIFLGLALGEHPFLQDETVAYIWIGSFFAAIVLAIILLVPAGLE